MAFTTYATRTDVGVYVPRAIEQVWLGDTAAVDDQLERASREINEWLLGQEKFTTSDIPIGLEADGKYPETLVKLTVYMAIWEAVAGRFAGEAFEDRWRWVRVMISETKSGIEMGKFRFSSVGDASSAGAYAASLVRRTV